MATKAQIEANRRNARNSSGPRTLAGKVRSRRNALKHGLAAQIVAENPSEETVAHYEQLFLKLANGDGASKIHARAAAEAQHVIEQVRGLRHMLINDAQASPWTFGRPIGWLDRVRFNFHRMPFEELQRRAVGGWENEDYVIVDRPPDDAQSFAICIRRLAPELRGLQRYETQAFCKRRKALRALLNF